MKRLMAVLGVAVGYAVFAALGYFMIEFFSNNHFDRSLEASMTSAFVVGPVGAIVGLVAGLVVGRRKNNPA
jgi:hypothetical protein